jgi:hypothetical protein
MNWIGAVEGGLTGTATLKVLQETLHRIDKKAPRPFLETNKYGKKVKKGKGKQRPAKQQVNKAVELLSGVLYFGIPALAEKSKAPVLGGLLGAAAGLWSAFGTKSEKKVKRKKKRRQQLYKLFLYTAAGILSGEAIRHLPGKDQIKPSAKKQWQEVEQQNTRKSAGIKQVSTILYIDEVPVGYHVHVDDHCLVFSPSQYMSCE